VVRESGLLPPLMRKEFHRGQGRMLLGLIPLGRFRVMGSMGSRVVSLIYPRWPLRDEITLQADGTWAGRGFAFGKEFCRFRMEPMPVRHALPRRRQHQLPV
jgi:hypothetical protein